MASGATFYDSCKRIEDCDTCAPVYQGSGCESCGPVCKPQPKTCETQCPPLRARNAIKLKDFETERWFNFSKHCRDDQFRALDHCMRMEISRVQRCDGPWTAVPLAADATGKVRFAWPQAFLAAPPGYYKAEVFLDGCHCSTLLLWKPFCKVDVYAGDSVRSHTCSTCGRSDGCGCSFVEVEQPPYAASPTDCGGCDAGCN